MFSSLGLILFGLLIFYPIPSRSLRDTFDEPRPRGFHSSTNSVIETKWAVLVAGSNYYINYRHQADVCHAYQILRSRGLKDENIIVFMSDDIAFHKSNPRPGIIYNRPQGPDVYKGVPKDYTGDAVTKENFYAVLLGNKSALTGGSGKVLKSGPNDHVFIFYVDHGSPGVIGMPEGDFVYAHELNDVLKKMYAAKSYKSLVFYLEACEAGTIFSGLLPEKMNIYATTASNSIENSYAYYCPSDIPKAQREYTTCLGDLYSISWMEDCENNNLGNETLKQQYELVKNRTMSEGTVEDPGSHVMQYGKLKMNVETISTYMGSKPLKHPYTSMNYSSSYLSRSTFRNVHQRDAELIHFMSKLQNSPKGSSEWSEAKNRVSMEMNQRKKVDINMKNIVQNLFGADKVKMILETTKPEGQPLVDDWNCFKESVTTYQKKCGRLSSYGRQYTRAIANMCNAGASIEQVAKAAAEVCSVGGF